ncbi:hypothetical protein V1477_002244 [Vespula maculifrons]|uniref:Uncharacterized protein n=1 Tax=Vespula maculifrons TaxID=7453 RepID=A0ABD2CVY2_VESMC
MLSPTHRMKSLLEFIFNIIHLLPKIELIILECFDKNYLVILTLILESFTRTEFSVRKNKWFAYKKCIFSP